jgi:hypothetical protein
MPLVPHRYCLENSNGYESSLCLFPFFIFIFFAVLFLVLFVFLVFLLGIESQL